MSSGKPAALVTGASAGIGAAFARRLSARGYRVILVARRGDRLAELARELGDAEALPADLTNPADLHRVEERIASEDRLELVINNAGFGLAGRFFETPVEEQTRMHELHVMATMRLSHAALRAMTARARGALINVSSVASFSQSPGSVSYCATKAWMTSFTEGLHLDLLSMNSPVKAQALCPGFTYSEFHDVMRMDRNAIPKWMWWQADDIVDTSLRALEKGKAIVVPGLLYKCVVALMKFIPRPLKDWGAVRYGRRRGQFTR